MYFLKLSMRADLKKTKLTSKLIPQSIFNINIPKRYIYHNLIKNFQYYKCNLLLWALFPIMPFFGSLIGKKNYQIKPNN